MKKLFLCFLAIGLLASVSSAEMLLTADSLGQGKFGLQTAFVNTSYDSTGSTLNNTGYGGLVGYGLLPALDIYGILKYVDFNNLGTPGTSVNGPQLGAAVKYRIIEEAPVSLSGIAAFKSTNCTQKSSGWQNNTVWEDWSGGLVLSKNLQTVTPYLGAAYHAEAIISDWGVSRLNDTEINAGLNFIPSKEMSILLEYALHTLVPTNGPSINGSNVSLSVGTKL